MVQEMNIRNCRNARLKSLFRIRQEKWIVNIFIIYKQLPCFCWISLCFRFGAPCFPFLRSYAPLQMQHKNKQATFLRLEERRGRHGSNASKLELVKSLRFDVNWGHQGLRRGHWGGRVAWYTHKSLQCLKKKSGSSLNSRIKWSLYKICFTQARRKFFKLNEINIKLSSPPLQHSFPLTCPPSPSPSASPAPSRVSASSWKKKWIL